MLENLLLQDLLDYINANRAGNLPEWSAPVRVQTEDIADKVFGIRDVKDTTNTIVCTPEKGEAKYFNGDDQHQYVLRFIKYEEFIDQFRTYKTDHSIDKDWTKKWSRPDYMAYDTTEEKRCVIIHELSIGNIRNKRKDGQIQLLNTVLTLCKVPAIKSFFEQFEGRCYCFLSARGCVDETPDGMANGFMEIYQNLPEPLPINNSAISRRGFQAFETRVVKL